MYEYIAPAVIGLLGSYLKSQGQPDYVPPDKAAAQVATEVPALYTPPKQVEMATPQDTRQQRQEQNFTNSAKEKALARLLGGQK